MANPWFRFYNEAIDDEKLRLLAYEDRWHFVALLCCKNLGILDENNDLMRRKVAVKLGLTVREAEEVIRRLAEVQLVDQGTWQPLAWEKGVNRPNAGLWAKIRTMIFERDNYTCQYCGARGVRLECDHVVPVSRGGGSESENLATACFSCNRSKRDKLVSEWRAT